MSARRILVLHPDGREVELSQMPSAFEIRMIVGGYAEHVRVLREDIKDRYVYTSMFVNERGLIDGLPRNQRATDIYLANIRRQFPDAANPAKVANEAFEKRFAGPDTVVHYIEPEGWDRDHPHIVGPAIWFDGYTVEEVDELQS